MAATIELPRTDEGKIADVFIDPIGRAKPTPKNPYGVAVGQEWEKTDDRAYCGHHPHYFQVVRVNLRGGWAEVVTPYVSTRTRRIKLTRFSPANHYRLYRPYV